MKNFSTVAHLAHSLSNRLESERAHLAKWRARLDSDPCYAMEWSDATFTTVARIRILEQYQVVRVDGDDEKPAIAMATKIVAELTRNVMREAKHPSRSTSVATNIFNQELMAAQAWLAEHVSGFVGEV